MNEALCYPFAPKRDLIDASRRITDMNAAATVSRVSGVTDMPRAG